VFSVRSIRFHLVAGLPIHPAVALWADSTRHESSGASRIRIIIHTIQSSSVSARPRRELRESQRQSIHCCTLKPTDQADLAVVYKGVSARFRRVGESYRAPSSALTLRMAPWRREEQCRVSSYSTSTRLYRSRCPRRRHAQTLFIIRKTLL
jgi:hypothetical protein